ncbi:MAG TPA: HAMP domain-containing sensor histidine kinase [Candidatus Limnocylindria bacterium]|nr:HAMP domain-containing sensor histidine kinase [Candidatus Limnocylindria bacterium]
MASGDPTAGANRAPAPSRKSELRLELPQLLRAYVFVGSSILVAGLFLFTHQMVSRLSLEVTTTSRVLARFCAQGSFPATRDPRLHQLLSEVVASIDFPLVISDTKGLPRAWRGVGVDPALVPAASIDSLDRGMPIAPTIRMRIERVRARMVELDRKNDPVMMEQPESGEPLGEVHYGDPEVLERLRWMPYVTVGGVMLLLSLGLWGLTTIRQAERRSIWVGMARETAHQLGTPLSSLMGWIELLRTRADEAPGSEVRIPRAEIDETLDEMERDVERLNKIAQRFSHVGSAPVLQLQDVTPVVRQAVQYLTKRMPRGDGEIVIRERYEEVRPINLNRELLEWAVENLLTNALTALDKRPGVIEVTVERRKETEAIELIVSDNGRGMSPAEQSRAFEPGYTSKRRGWGLGLALTRRVIEDYHGGRLFIRHSAPGQGTTMVISFPT